MNEDQFVKEVVDRLVAEHGVAREVFATYEDKIRAAYPTEQHITSDELDMLIHAGGVEDGEQAANELAEAYPLLHKLVLGAYIDENIPDEDDEDDDEDEEDDEDHDADEESDDE